MFTSGVLRQLPVPVDQSSAAERLLQASESLWEAADLESVVASAHELLQALAPGINVGRCARHAAPFIADAALASLQVVLSDSEVLVITATDHAERALLEKAVGMIRARVRALDEHVTLAQSVEQLGHAERLQRALYAIADQASAVEADTTAMFAALHRIIGTLMYAANFYIALYDAALDTVRFVYYADIADPEIPDPHRAMPMSEIMHGPTWYVIRDGKPLMGSLPEIGTQVSGPFHGIGAECIDLLGVPLMHGSEVAGCVVVQSYDEAHHYDEADKALLAYVAQHIQTALERRFAHVELEQRVEARTEALRDANRVLKQEVLERQRGEQLQAALFRIAELASTADSLDQFYAAVHRVVGELLYANNFYIALLSEGDADLTFPYKVDERNPDQSPRKLSDGLTEYVIRRGDALLADADELERLRERGDIRRASDGAVCWLGVPLVCGDHTVGALAVQSYSPEHHYSPRDQELLTFVSYHIANALERIRAVESLHLAYADLERRVGERTRELATANGDLRAQIVERERVEVRLKYETLHDSLTGLPNRSLLMQRLQQALARARANPGTGFAVLFMDLDRFKVINDSVGHLVGDELLCRAGERIRAGVKPEDVVARLGGDEFGVLLEGVTDARQACAVARRIIGKLNAPFHLGAKELFTSASVGITLAGADERQPEELLRDADAAMYRAKEDGRHRYALFDEGLRREAVSLLELENDLRRTPVHGEFVPFYQPIVALADGRTVGYEALMRWRHPQRGLLLPGEFLGVAEDIGASETIDWRIFEQVCDDARALTRDGGFVSVNLSPRHFRNPELDRRLLRMLADHDLAPGRLRVEITERAMLENPPEAKRMLQTLRGAGIAISLDDFGTGYSSLSYLHQYPVQTIKIDRSFITSMMCDSGRGSEAVIRTIIAMARLLSMQVIAEGVETVAQRDQLISLGCPYAQGFLYSQAQPLGAWVDARRIQA